MLDRTLAWLLIRYTKLLDAYLNLTQETQGFISEIKMLRELLNHLRGDLRQYIQQLSSKQREKIGIAQQYHTYDTELTHIAHHLDQLLKQWHYLLKNLHNHYEQLRNLQVTETASESDDDYETTEETEALQTFEKITRLKGVIYPKTMMLLHEYELLKKQLMALSEPLKAMHKQTLSPLLDTKFTHQNLIKTTARKTLNTEKACYTAGLRLAKLQIAFKQNLKQGKELYQTLKKQVNVQPSSVR